MARRIRNDHGMLFYDDANPELLPHLLVFEDGVFEPTGKVDVDPSLVDIHNNLFDQALIAGLKTCEKGQCGIFYYTGDQVRTFTGKVVAEKPTVNGSVITFLYDKKTFRGQLRKDADCFEFKRVA